MGKKLSYEYVKQKFEERGYKLLSKEYKHKDLLLDIECPVGHETTISWNSFRHGRDCKICSGNQRMNIEVVRKCFDDRGFTLLSEEYKNNSKPLDFLCDKKHKDTISLMSLRNGKGCSICANNKTYTTEYIREEISKYGFTLLSCYNNSKSDIVVECQEGHIITTTWNKINSGSGCSICSKRKKYTIEEVREFFEKEGYKLLSTKYEGSNKKLDYLCCNNHKRKITFDAFKNQGHRCSLCSKGKSISKKSQKWLDQQKVTNREVKIPGFRFIVDGFDPTTNTIYEFLGDYWHGGYRKDLVGENKLNNTLFEKLRSQTFVRFEKLKDAGYNIVYIWESDYKKGKNPQKY